jgi:hypothetical protein
MEKTPPSGITGLLGIDKVNKNIERIKNASDLISGCISNR